MEDILFEVAMRSKLYTIISIMGVLPKLNTPYFWKLKCLKDYPNNCYLDCWTGPENYLVGKNKFLLNVYMNENNMIHDIDNLYEYTPIIRKIKYPTTPSEKGYEPLEWVLVKNIRQYVVIVDEDDTFDAQCYSTPDFKLNTYEWDIVVIDLAHMSPSFIKYGVIKKRARVEPRYYPKH